MPKYTVTPQQITDEMVIDFASLPHKADYNTNLIPLKQLEASEKVLNFALRQRPYHPFKNKYVKDNVEYIGYLSTNKADMDNPNGMLEKQAYSKWIETWKDAERNFKKYFPLDSVSQNQYDAMLSLYYHTGFWDRVGTDIANFNIKNDVINRKWDRVATALIYNGNKRIRSQAEAKMMMLGDYGRQVSRDVLKRNGVQLIQSMYPRLEDAVKRQQCELIYFIETTTFLPGLTQARQRQIVSYVEENRITTNQIFKTVLPEVVHLVELDEPIDPDAQ